MTEAIAMQSAIDLDTEAPVCILNPDLDTQTLARAVQARAEHLQALVMTMQCVSGGMSVNPHEIVEMFAPTIGDLATVATALRQRIESNAVGPVTELFVGGTR